MAPRLTELLAHFTTQLVNMYPNPIPLSDVGIFYARHYGAEVDPERLYAKSWANLFATTFSSRTMVKDGCIHLHEAYVKKHNIKPKHADQSHAKAENLQLAIINDLNESSLESSDESEEEDECQEIDEADISLTSIPLESAWNDSIGAIPLPQKPHPTLVLPTQRPNTLNSFPCSVEPGQPKQKIPVKGSPPKVNMSKTLDSPKVKTQDSPIRVKVVDRIKKPDQIRKEPENRRPEASIGPTATAKAFNSQYFARIGTPKKTSTQPQKKTEPKPKETPRKAEKQQTKKPMQVVEDQELSSMANCFASLVVTSAHAPSATKATVPTKPREKKEASVKFDPVDDVKRRCAEKMALMAEAKPEGTIRTCTSIAASVLPQRTRRAMLLKKVTGFDYS